jgi:phosphonate transport system substrate-binding protein
MIARFLVATAAAFIAFAAPASAQDWKSQYKTVRIGVLSGENEKDRLQRYGGFKTYMSNELGVPVEIFTASSYDGVIEALAGKQIEFAFLGSSAYAAAWTETKGNVEPLLAKREADGSTGYYSVVVVRCNSPYKKIEDLKGKVLAFADPDSTSGYAVPYFNLRKQGYAPETYFSSTPFSGSHETGVLGVVNKQFDAAATYINNQTNGIPQRMVSKGMIKAGEACWIWTSPEITNGPFTAVADLPPALKDAVKAAFVGLPAKDPVVFKQVDGGDVSTGSGYIEVDHKRYDWIVELREVIRELRKKRAS